VNCLLSFSIGARSWIASDGATASVSFSAIETILSHSGNPAIVLSARAGYLVHLHHDGWHEKDGRGEDRGLPNTPLEGFYAELSIGFALMEEK
jgi:hypothetical protein